MQEQLKAQQLEELLRLQEQQQRLLGRMNGSQDYAAGKKMRQMMRRHANGNTRSFSQDKRGDCRDKYTFGVKLQPCLFWVGSTQTQEDDEGDSSLFYQQSDILQANNGEALPEDCDRREDEVCSDR